MGIMDNFPPFWNVEMTFFMKSGYTTQQSRWQCHKVKHSKGRKSKMSA